MGLKNSRRSRPRQKGTKSPQADETSNQRERGSNKNWAALLPLFFSLSLFLSSLSRQRAAVPPKRKISYSLETPLSLLSSSSNFANGIDVESLTLESLARRDPLEREKIWNRGRRVIELEFRIFCWYRARGWRNDWTTP